MTRTVELGLIEDVPTEENELEQVYEKVRAKHRSLYARARSIPEGIYHGEIVAMYPAETKIIVTLIRVEDGPEAGTIVKTFNNLARDASKRRFKGELKLMRFDVRSAAELIDRGDEIVGRVVRFSCETNVTGSQDCRILGAVGPLPEEKASDLDAW